MEVLFKRVLNLCNENNLTIYRAEQKLMWANGTIKKMKTSVPSSFKVIQLAEFFDVTADYLLGLADDRHGVPEDFMDEWNLLDNLQRAYVQGVIRGLLLNNDEVELDSIDKTSHLEIQKKNIQKHIEKLNQELTILEAKDKRTMKTDVRGY